MNPWVIVLPVRPNGRDPRRIIGRLPVGSSWRILIMPGTRCERYTWSVRIPIMRSPRFLPAALGAVALSALLGGFFGGNVATAQDEVTQQYRIYTEALARVESEYVEAVPVERLV